VTHEDRVASRSTKDEGRSSLTGVVNPSWFTWPARSKTTAAAVALVGLLAALACFPFARKASSSSENSSRVLIPNKTQAARALTLDARLQGGPHTTAVLVARYSHPIALHPRVLATRLEKALLMTPGLSGDVVDHVFRASNHTALAIFITLSSNGSRLDASLKTLDSLGKSILPGARTAIGGPAAIQSDVLGSFSGVDGEILLVTILLVAGLLVLMYRSPLLVISVLGSMAVAEILAMALAWVLLRAGVSIDSEDLGFMTVVVFGAGTDYALLLIARYREFLRADETRHTPRAALQATLTRASPTIAASGATVIAALACLLASNWAVATGFGTVGMIAIGSCLLSLLAFFPSTLAIAGKTVFWPWHPIKQRGLRGAWPWVARNVTQHPSLSWACASAFLVALTAGLVTINTSVSTISELPASSSARIAQRLATGPFPSGITSPLEVLDTSSRAIEHLEDTLATSRLVFWIGNVEQRNGVAGFPVVLRGSTTGSQGFQHFTALEAVVHKAIGAREPRAYIAGQLALDVGGAEVATRAELLLVPLVMVAVAILLWALLRALLGVLIAVACVGLSTAAALGSMALLTRFVFGYPGVDPSVPVLSFVFLMALSTDYTVFVLLRSKEETRNVGYARGAMRAVASTASVLTSAGLILAATFSVLMVLPLVASAEIGLTIALGVLFDTFLIRSILLPAAATDLGPAFWWPGLRLGTHALCHERELPRTD
jgi:RND superfamily putative drug exporter